MVFVNMLGQRFANEDVAALGKYCDDAYAWFDLALSSVVVDPDGDGNCVRYGGPIWAIIDQDECTRNDWNLTQDAVDYENGYAFKADTLEELAAKVINKYYEDVKMDPATLAETIANWNSYVDAGEDPEFGVSEHLTYKVENGPFYALWATPALHDTLTGLRVNPQMQVYDIHGELIDGLYCAGESCAGQRTHGLGRVLTMGYIAGRTAAAGGSDDEATVSERYYATYREDVVPDLTDIPTGEEGTEASAGGDGTYSGTSGSGQGGTIRLEVRVEGGVITAIEVVEENETPELGGEAKVRKTQASAQPYARSTSWMRSSRARTPVFL